MFPDSVLTVMANNFILFTENAEGLFYFLLGAYLVSHSFSRAARIAIYLAGAISLLCAIVLNYSDALLSGWDLYYVNRGNALIAVMSASVFVLFGRVFRNASLGRLSKWLVECGLMIYLIHPFVRQILESCDAFSWVVAFLLDNALLGIPLVTLAVYLVSLLVASFFKVGCNAARRLISR